MQEDFYFKDLKFFLSVAYVLKSLDITFEPSLNYLGNGDYEFCIHILGDD